MSLIKGINHICMKTNSDEEYEKTYNFYHNILGFNIARKWDNGIMFDSGDGMIEIFQNGTCQMELGVIRHFALATDNLVECEKKVREAGYEIFMGPKDVEFNSNPVFKARVFFCFGPLGEQVEFIQEG